MLSSHTVYRLLPSEDYQEFITEKETKSTTGGTLSKRLHPFMKNVFV